MTLRIYGATSGYVDLDAPAVAGSASVTLPGSGTLATTAGVDTAVAPMGLVAVAPTSIANSGGSASLSNYTVSFSGVSSVSLNGCFTGDYDNYRLLVTITTTSVQADLTMRLRASGTDATGSNYNYAWRGNSVTNTETSAGTNAQAQMVLGNIGLTSGTNVGAHYSLDVRDVFAARRTAILGEALNSGPGVIVENVNVYGAIHTLANAYDGLTVYPASGTIGGSLSVYGYKK